MTIYSIHRSFLEQIISNDPKIAALGRDKLTALLAAPTIEDQIRSLAAKGESKREVHKILNISMYALRNHIKRMPDVVWAPNGRTMGHVREQISRRENPDWCVRHLTESRKLGTQKSIEKLRVHEICGVKGTMKELREMWIEYVDVSISTVYNRVARGLCLYDALFMPIIPYSERTKMNLGSLKIEKGATK